MYYHSSISISRTLLMCGMKGVKVFGCVSNILRKITTPTESILFCNFNHDCRKMTFSSVLITGPFSVADILIHSFSDSVEFSGEPFSKSISWDALALVLAPMTVFGTKLSLLMRMRLRTLLSFKKSVGGTLTEK